MQSKKNNNTQGACNLPSEMREGADVSSTQISPGNSVDDAVRKENFLLQSPSGVITPTEGGLRKPFASGHLVLFTSGKLTLERNRKL